MTAVAFIPALIFLGTTILACLRCRFWRRTAMEWRQSSHEWQKMQRRTLDIVEQQSFMWPGNARSTIHEPKE